MTRQSLGELKPQIAQVWKLSLPAILTQLTTIAMEYIDSAMVGSLGANASAAIGLVASSTWLMSGVTYAVSAGFSVQVAHAIGAGKSAEARNVVRHGLAAALVLAGMLGLLGVLISSSLPRWLGGETAIQANAAAYFLIFSLVLPFFQLNNLCSSFLQCSGDMVTPSLLNGGMCLLDVLFNMFFIPRYGVMGAGIGTGLACFVTSLVMTWFCCVRNPHLRLPHSGKGTFQPGTIRYYPVISDETADNGDNRNHIPLDVTDSGSVTHAEIASRRLLYEKMKAGLKILGAAPAVAPREGRRIAGLTELKSEDYCAGRVFEDSVCYSFWFVDIHREGQAAYIRYITHGNTPTIRLSNLISRDVPNLMMAGRCISSDRETNSALRVKASCMAMGQAAGTAAAMAAREGMDPRDVQVDRLLKLLDENGAIIPGKPRNFKEML